MRNQLNNLIVITVIAAAIAPAADVMAEEFNIANGNVPGLIAAIDTANGNGDFDNVINLARGGTYILTEPYQEPGDPLPTNGLPVITSPKGKLTINGNGATILRADGAPSFRIFEIHGVALNLNDLCLSGGNVGPEGGGAIFLWGPGVVTLTNCTVDGNVASERGGGIYNQGGTVNATNCTFNNNTATMQEAGKGGGGISNDDGGTVELNGCTLSGNSGYEGGAFRNGTDCSFALNDCSLAGNNAFNGGAGFIAPGSGPFQCTGTTFSNNFAEWDGGALVHYNTQDLELTETDFTLNTATNFGGGLCHFGTGQITISGCNFIGNAAFRGGAIATTDSAPIAIVSTTITNNNATEHGGIYNSENAPVTVIDTIVAFNFPNPFWGDVFAPNQVIKILPPDVSGAQRLGAYVAVGDINGDGGLDVIAGAPGRSRVFEDVTYFSAGAVFIFENFLGPDSGIQFIESPVPNHNTFFGHDLAVGDLNGDGLDDLIIGEHGFNDGSVIKGRTHTLNLDGPGVTFILDNPIVGSNYRNFGAAFGLLDNTLAVGHRAGGNTCGEVDVYESSGGLGAGGDPLVLKQRLFGPPQFFAQYGAAVAIDGDVIVGGAPRYTYEGMTFSGGIVIHELIDDEWVSVATLVPSNVGAGDEVGSAVAIRGNTIFAAGETHDPPAGSNAGAVWVYERIDGTWVETAQLLASDGSQFGRFGASLHFRDDDTLFVGSTGTSHEGVETGGVYEFRRDADGSWVEVQKIVPLDAKVTTGMGSAMDTHGTLLIAGAARDYEITPLAGSVYVFDLEPGKTPPACPGDLNDSGAVDVQDLLILLSAWGPCGKGLGSCPADLNNSGAVDVQDLLILLSAWGPCPG